MSESNNKHELIIDKKKETKRRTKLIIDGFCREECESKRLVSELKEAMIRFMPDQMTYKGSVIRLCDTGFFWCDGYFSRRRIFKDCALPILLAANNKLICASTLRLFEALIQDQIIPITQYSTTCGTLSNAWAVATYRLHPSELDIKKLLNNDAWFTTVDNEQFERIQRYQAKINAKVIKNGNACGVKEFLSQWSIDGPAPPLEETLTKIQNAFNKDEDEEHDSDSSNDELCDSAYSDGLCNDFRLYGISEGDESDESDQDTHDSATNPVTKSPMKTMKMAEVYIFQLSFQIISIFVCIQCGSCSRSLLQGKRLICRCHTRLYCNRSCQSKDWAKHKEPCKILQQLKDIYEFIGILHGKTKGDEAQKLQEAALQILKAIVSISGKPNHLEVTSTHTSSHTSKIEKVYIMYCFGVHYRREKFVDFLERYSSQTQKRLGHTALLNDFERVRREYNQRFPNLAINNQTTLCAVLCDIVNRWNMPSDRNKGLEWKRRGFAKYRQGKYTQAIDRLSKSLQCARDSFTPIEASAIHACRGLSYVKVGKYVCAAQDGYVYLAGNIMKYVFFLSSKNAVRKNRHSATAYATCAWANLGLGNYSDAHKSFEKMRTMTSPYMERDWSADDIDLLEQNISMIAASKRKERVVFQFDRLMQNKIIQKHMRRPIDENKAMIVLGKLLNNPKKMKTVFELIFKDERMTQLREIDSNFDCVMNKIKKGDYFAFLEFNPAALEIVRELFKTYYSLAMKNFFI